MLHCCNYRRGTESRRVGIRHYCSRRGIHQRGGVEDEEDRAAEKTLSLHLWIPQHVAVMFGIAWEAAKGPGEKLTEEEMVGPGRKGGKVQKLSQRRGAECWPNHLVGWHQPLAS